MDDIDIPSPEELERAILGLDRETTVLTKCVSCGFEEKVPDFIYDEFACKKFYKKFKKSIPTIACGRCSNNSAIPSKNFEV